MKAIRVLKTTLVALVLSFAFASVSEAQMMSGMGMTQPFSTDDVADMSEFLSMDDDQKGVVLDMHSAYFANWSKDQKVLMEAVQAVTEEFQTNNDMSVFLDLNEMMQDFEKSSGKNLDALFEDVALVLNEDQFTRWQAYKLRSFRRRTLPTVTGQGVSVSGASTDLIAIYEDSVEPDIQDEEVKQNLAGIFLSYGREMDTALRSFIVVKAKTTEESMEIGMDWLNNMEAVEDLLKRFTDAAIGVRKVNDRYQGRIAAAIPSEPRAEWKKQYNRSAAPAVYTPTFIHEAFDIALEMSELTEDQSTQITDLKARYESSAATLNSKWVAALRDSEENISFQAMMQGQLQSKEVGERRKDRTEFDAQIYEQLSSLLTEEQREHLPAKPASNWRDRFQFSNGQ